MRGWPGFCEAATPACQPPIAGSPIIAPKARPALLDRHIPGRRAHPREHALGICPRPGRPSGRRVGAQHIADDIAVTESAVPECGGQREHSQPRLPQP